MKRRGMPEYRRERERRTSQMNAHKMPRVVITSFSSCWSCRFWAFFFHSQFMRTRIHLRRAKRREKKRRIFPAFASHSNIIAGFSCVAALAKTATRPSGSWCHSNSLAAQTHTLSHRRAEDTRKRNKSLENEYECEERAVNATQRDVYVRLITGSAHELAHSYLLKRSERSGAAVAQLLGSRLMCSLHDAHRSVGARECPVRAEHPDAGTSAKTSRSYRFGG